MAGLSERFPLSVKFCQTLAPVLEDFENEIAPSRKYGFKAALWDMSLWGTLKSIHADVIHRNRSENTVRMIEILGMDCEKEFSEINSSAKKVASLVRTLVEQTKIFFKGESSSAQFGICLKAVYLGSLTLAGLEYLAGTPFLRSVGSLGVVASLCYFYADAVHSSGNEVCATAGIVEFPWLKKNLEVLSATLSLTPGRTILFH
jgi:hypothetical protein